MSTKKIFKLLESGNVDSFRLKNLIRSLEYDFKNEYAHEFALRALLLLNPGDILTVNEDKITFADEYYFLNDNQSSYEELFNFILNIRDIKNVEVFMNGSVYEVQDLVHFIRKVNITQTILKRLSDSPVSDIDAEIRQRVFKTMPISYYDMLTNIEYMHSHKNIEQRFKELKELLLTYDKVYKFTEPIRKVLINQIDERNPVDVVIGKKLRKPICEYKEFEKLANHPDYGYIVAGLIYAGCLEFGISMEQLMYTWITLKKEIEALMTEIPHDKTIPKAVKIYKKLQESYNYQYCATTYNFIANFYMSSMCNCVCGTFLIYTINNLLPVNEQEILFFLINPRHIQLLFNNKGTWFVIESTAQDIHTWKYQITGTEFFAHGNEKLAVIGMWTTSTSENYDLEDPNNLIDSVYKFLDAKPFNPEKDDFDTFCDNLNKDFIHTELEENALYNIIYFVCFGRYDRQFFIHHLEDKLYKAYDYIKSQKCLEVGKSDSEIVLIAKSDSDPSLHSDPSLRSEIYCFTFEELENVEELYKGDKTYYKLPEIGIIVDESVSNALMKGSTTIRLTDEYTDGDIVVWSGQSIDRSLIF